ncbi:MAG TPA: hypothetical protein VNF49_14070 [Candidatus Binataceae bacterium]|nr:hypothetical protein [Candidatus Binataceae bacterium]
MALIDPMHYPDISLACRALGEGGAQCAAGARHAGLVSLLGLGAALALAWGLRPPDGGREPAGTRHERVLPLALGAAAGVATAALVGQITASFSLSRVQEITQHSTVISIANLGFPLLLQLSVLAPSSRVRIGYLAAAVALLCISPFRATFLAAVFFGIVLPAVEALFSGRARRAMLTRRSLSLAAAGVFGAVVLIAGIILYQTAQRSAPLFAAAPSAEHYAGSLVPKLTQRIAYPLYQAHFAEAVASVEPLPSVRDELASKLRLGKHVNLNEALYGMIYGPGSVGETTSLYYGEAAVRTALAPLAWVVAGPLLYVLAWLALRRLRVDAGVLAGLALWRGSLGGVFSVLPAFVIQSAVLLMLCRAPGLGAGARGRTTPEEA